MIALDASVAVKWFLPEEGSEEALKLLEETPRFVAPELIKVEVLAAITRRVRLGVLPAFEAGRCCADWLGRANSTLFVLLPQEELLPQAVTLALQLKHPLQDCLYLAAAMHSGIPLLTADRLFHGRSSDCYSGVRLLGSAAS